MYRPDLRWRQQREGEDNEDRELSHRMTSTRSTESYDMERSTTSLNNTTVVFGYGRWVFVRLMGQGR